MADERIPIILVPGWGHDYAPAVLGQAVFNNYIRWLDESGFPRRHTHEVRYSYQESVHTIAAEVRMQLEQIMRYYPSSTKFDMMGHSLGGFVGLYAVMEAGLGHRIRKFVSLAGIPFGWNSPECATGLCGEAHTLLIPFRNQWIMQFHDRHRRTISQLQTCSLFSRADEFVEPYDAGRMPGGTHVEVPNMGHMDVVLDYDAFRAMLRHCYGR